MLEAHETKMSEQLTSASDKATTRSEALELRMAESKRVALENEKSSIHTR